MQPIPEANATLLANPVDDIPVAANKPNPAVTAAGGIK